MSIQRILIKGRLGNQMFIYAFARALSLEEGNTPVLIDDWLMKKNIANRLDCFCLSPKVAFSHGNGMTLLQKLVLEIVVKILHNTKRIKRHALELKMQSTLSKFGIFYITDGYAPLPCKTMLQSRDFYMEGYFQAIQYFSKHRDVILKDFRFRPFIVDSCTPMASMIEDSHEATCLHVRLGDYVNHHLHGIINADYYRRALARLKEQKPQAKVFLFSDNIQLARKELHLSDEVVSLPEIYNEQQTLYLGSLCKNFIISNSSFSWWMQYLSQTPDKLVIAPHRWYAQDIPCEIYQDNWQLLEI